MFDANAGTLGEQTIVSTEFSPARAIGLELLEATSRLDLPMGVKRGIGGVDLALLAFGVRARRLLRASYRLVDADEEDAANALFRVMSEYLIVGRWLQMVGEKGAQGWALNDLRDRRSTIVEVIESVEADAGVTASLEKELANIEEALRGYGGPKAAMSKRAASKAGEKPTPPLAQMANETGLKFAYSYAYRLQSQTDVHATALSIDTVFEEEQPGDPGPRMRAKPQSSLWDYDAYAVGAHLLLDVLRPVAERFPELGWRESLDGIDVKLAAIPYAAGG